MRKFLTLSSLAMFLLACSISSLPGMPAPLPPTETPLPLPTSTFTPAIPPTFTFTPTLIGAKPTEPPTETPVPTDQVLFITPPTPTPIPIFPTSLEQSVDLFYWGACDPHAVSITVQVGAPSQVFSVELFLKYRNKDTGGNTGWNQGLSLNGVGGGTYTIILNGQDMGVYNNNSWVIYQLVATDSNGKEVARTPAFPESLTLSKCP
jgi:hypothetical protein